MTVTFGSFLGNLGHFGVVSTFGLLARLCGEVGLCRDGWIGCPIGAETLGGESRRAEASNLGPGTARGDDKAAPAETCPSATGPL